MQFALAFACSKIAKEYVLPAHGLKDNAAKMKDKLTGKINNETLTRGIKHWGLSGYSSILPRTKFGVSGQESSPQSPTISYRRPLPTRLRNILQT